MSFLFLQIPPRKDGILELPRWGYLETPLPLPQSLYGRTDARLLTRSYGDVITKFSRLDGFTKFSKEWCSARAPSARRSSAKT